MTKALKMIANGIKCDTPGCDCRFEEVSFEDYEKWVDRPCPKCGGNLLTWDDLDAVRAISRAVNAINAFIGEIREAPPDAPRLRINAEMNGTGEVTFRFRPFGPRTPQPSDD